MTSAITTLVVLIALLMLFVSCLMIRHERYSQHKKKAEQSLTSKQRRSGVVEVGKYTPRIVRAGTSNSRNNTTSNKALDEDFFTKSSRSAFRPSRELAGESTESLSRNSTKKEQIKIQRRGFIPATSCGITLTPFEAEYRLNQETGKKHLISVSCHYHTNVPMKEIDGALLVEATRITISKDKSGSSYRFRTGTDTRLTQSGAVESSFELQSVLERLLEGNSWVQ